MICSKCQAQNRENAKFCRGCGSGLPGGSAVSAIPTTFGSAPRMIPAMQAPSSIVVSSIGAPSIVVTPAAVPHHLQAVSSAPVMVSVPASSSSEMPRASCCPGCNARRRQSDWFCGQCGLRLPTAQAPLCIRCGSVLCNNQKFCHSCGAGVITLSLESSAS